MIPPRNGEGGRRAAADGWGLSLRHGRPPDLIRIVPAIHVLLGGAGSAQITRPSCRFNLTLLACRGERRCAFGAARRVGERTMYRAIAAASATLFILLAGPEPASASCCQFKNRCTTAPKDSCLRQHGTPKGGLCMMAHTRCMYVKKQ